mmetsp:Transcript_70202/g.154803  ORF Transcript_70202/g.154803 Transcript_70202/m.154803 type:complete len:289 (+) Transcript_70202:83-949(+)
MGTKVAVAYVVACSLAALGQLISLFTRWHMAGGNLIFTMDTTLFSSKMSGGGLSFLCTTLLKKWSQCQELSKGMWLQDIQSQTCAPLLVHLHSGPCDAYKAAYILGIVSVLTYITNWILMACSCGMLWQYLSGKHKPEYRDWSFYLICAGVLVVLIALLLWSFIALPALDRLGSIVNWGGNPAGASYGYFFMWFSFIFQCAATFLHWWMPLSNEMTEEDRLQQQMRKEYQQYGAAQASQAPGAYAPGYYESPQTAGYGAPYGAPAPGYGGPSAPPYGAQGMPAHRGQA